MIVPQRTRTRQDSEKVLYFKVLLFPSSKQKHVQEKNKQDINNIIDSLLGEHTLKKLHGCHGTCTDDMDKTDASP